MFNWLYARHHGGKFLLRIEDTDRQRSTEGAVQVIFDSLAWLGLDYAPPPVFQFARADVHRAAVEQLVERGWAFRCYMTPEESEAAKAVARTEGHALHSPWRDRQPGPEQTDRPYVIRFKTPLEGETVVEDLIRGTVRFPNKDLDDLILLRTDGDPTYNLAVTVDDHDMGVTHVIRGEEHLSNAARQALIYRAMDWPVPYFAHAPLIVGADGAKLSKRHGAQTVGDFKEMGYLPEAMRNYLARLGWGHGDDEIFSDEQAIAWFDVKDVVKAPARLDLAKLSAVNAHYIRIADDDRLTTLVAELLAQQGNPLSPEDQAKLRRVVPLVKDGAKTLLDLPDLAHFVLHRPRALDEKTTNLLASEAGERLVRPRAHLGAQNGWTTADLDSLIRRFAEEEGVGLGRVGPVLRGVLTGGAPSPDLGSTLFALQRDEALARIDDALSRAV